MKKKLLLLIAGFSLSLSISAQTLFVPAGTNGIGSSGNGNVGIGTATPSEKLTIGGSHGDTKLRLYSTGNGSDEPSNLSLWASEPGWTYYGTGIGYNVNGSPYYGRIDNARGSSYLRFLPGETKFEFQNTSGNYIKAITIKDNGNIGIGTEEPLGKLHIEAGYPSIYITSTDPYPYAALRGNNGTWLFGYGNIPRMEDISIGTQDGSGQRTLTLAAGGSAKLKIVANGNVGIGTTIPDQKLTVKGKIHAEEVIVDLNVPVADYVFKPTYKLMPLHEVEQFVKTNSHLPEIPSSTEISKNGLSMGEMQNKLLQKVEELTLYAIQQNKKIETLEKRINELETK